MSSIKLEPIAVVGLAGIFPKSETEVEFWRNIVAGRDLFEDVPESHWLISDYYDRDPSAPDKTYSKRGGFLPSIDFDPLEFGIPPSSLPSIDTAQLISLVLAKRALQDACGPDLARLDREQTSVILGFTGVGEAVGPLVSRLQRPIWVKSMREAGIPEDEVQAAADRIAASYVPWQESSFPGLLGNVVSGRIANRLDLHGTNVTVDAACASALAAMSVGIDELRLGKSKLVLAGGVDANNDIFAYMCFSKTPAFSRTDESRPFSAEADGTLLGEGIGMFVLKRLDDAERDGDRVYGVVHAVGSSSDGRSKSIYAPAAEGQARALRRAYASSGFAPRSVELVEAHGTATPAGDAAEFAGLVQVFGSDAGAARQWCALGSIKSQMGHAKAAAGAAGLFKTLMALHHKILPPTIHLDRPNPALGVEDSPFYLSPVARPWIRAPGEARRAAVSSFGFGGTNFHATLSEYIPRPAARLRSAPTELILISAGSAAQLTARCQEILGGEASLERLAHDTQLGFDSGAPLRAAVVVSSREELGKRLGELAQRLAEPNLKSISTPSGLYLSVDAPVQGEIAFLFPGQGSQYVGMGADLAMGFELARSVWDEAAAERYDGQAVHELAFPLPAFDDAGRAAAEERLRATEWAQPAIGLHSLALLDLFTAIGVRASSVAGHSFGELTALTAAGALDRPTFRRLARRRGEVMRDAARSTPGAMLSIQASAERVRELIREHGAVIANYNGPEAVVASGAVEAIASLERACEASNIASTRLSVATAFHSPLVAGAVAGLRAFLDDAPVAGPSIPAFSTADGAPYPSDPHQIRARLAEQLAQPVQFTAVIEAMYARGARIFIELGPSQVIGGLVGSILGAREHLAVSTDRRGKNGATSLDHALARLAAAGVRMDLAALWKGFAVPPAPAGKDRKTVRLNGTNYGKVYPPPGGAAALPGPNPPRPAPTPTGGAGPALPEAWLGAYQEAQRRTAEAHAAVQRTMMETHAAFLRAAEASFGTLASIAQGGMPPSPHAPGAPAWLAPPQVALASAPWTPSAPWAAPAPRPPAAPPQKVEPPPAPLPAAAPPRTPEPAAPAPSASPEARSAEADPTAMLLSIVAEKTGYEVEMLGLDMELESDLGIDSIKRVEIFAALRDSVPSLPKVERRELVGLKTIRQVLDFMNQAPSAGPSLASPTASPAPAAAELTRAKMVLVDAPAPGAPMRRLLGGDRVVVTDDGGGVADALVAELRARGVRAERMVEVPPDARAVVFLGGLREVKSDEDALAINGEALRAARAVGARFEVEPGLLVTVQDTGGDFGATGADARRAWLGGVGALVRTARHEWPDASLKAIDCKRGTLDAPQQARRIADELFLGGDALSVGLGPDRRVVLESLAVPLEITTPVPPLDASSVVLATGGARGVTAASMVELAKAHHPKIALFGRSALIEEPEATRDAQDENAIRRALTAEATRRGEEPQPKQIRQGAKDILVSREIRTTLEALAQAGSEARYFSVDVADPAAVTAALGEVRATLGPITALVHGAGVLADRLIAHQTDEQLGQVFAAKVGGLRSLLALTASDPLTHLILFSSVASIAGNSGQVAYAMANEVLNHVAQAERTRRPRGIVRAIAWGPWEGGMMNKTLQRAFKEQGVALLPLEAGARAFIRELSGGEEGLVSIGAVAPASGARV
ncbi:MAG: SDR family NAD(P)-dependent oxidoreductase [Myxococcota bacterium]